MNPRLVSFNGTAINDGSNYRAFLPADMDLQGSARINNVNIAGRRPKLASKTLNGLMLDITVQCLGTLSTQVDTIKALFDVEDETPRKLLIKDLDNSNKEWYVYATPAENPRLVKNIVYITLAIADPVWYANADSTATWTITGTGQTKAVVPVGNRPARPKFTITPTAAGGSRYAYKRLAIWRNPTAYAQLNYPLMVTGAVFDTAALVALSGIHVTINDGDGITDSDTTITFDGEVGTLPNQGMAYLGTEQISYTGKTATQLTGVTRGINGTTAAAHANDVVIYASKIQADGNDIRVFIGGVETERWLYDMNTANTKIWIAVNLQPGISLTTSVAIASSGAITTITLANTKANKAALSKLRPSGQALIGSELFTYNGKNEKSLTLTGVTREAKGTSAAAHGVGSTLYWIEHEIYIYYGNQSADAPESDDTRKPIIDLTSTNTSWIYTSFYDITGLRPGSWRPALVKSANLLDPDRKSGYYTGDRLALADPATELGAVGYAFKSGSVWKAENFTVEWSLFNPATITEITASGEKYRAYSNWPYARLYKSSGGSTWSIVWTDATPSAAATWEALAAHSAVSLGTGTSYIKFSFSGALGTSLDNYAAYEIEAVTLTLSSAGVPQVVLGSEISCYFIDAKITNNTSGEWLKVKTSCPLNGDIIIDCNTKDAYLEDNTPVPMNEFSSTRKDWLNLAVGSNTLQFDDVGTAGVDIAIAWADRNS